MKGALAYLFGSLVLVSACAPRFDVMDEQGVPMFEVHKSGVCFIGCNLKVKRADGVVCSGFAPGIEGGKGLSALIRCPDEPAAGTRSLVTTPLRTDMAAIGRLGPLKTTAERNRNAIDKALAYTDQLSKKN